MCGITGKIFFEHSVDAHDIEKMNHALLHRGPDDHGIYLSPDKKIGLGHQRLAIIDTSSAGHQPMRYKDRFVIVFNGEIYNFREKKAFLEKKGYSFQSHSDTEVLLALYDEYGVECLQHLRGMFSFAIYDEKEQTLFCARDRVGKKPFKYYTDGNVFLFASELKAILTQKEYHKEPDYIAIHHYLTLQYVPAPLTGFVGIKKLEPAHYIFLDLKTKKIEKKRYWKLDYSKKLDLSEKEWGKRILEKLEESVKMRMISDVPLGAFLSGGIDSSAIVALMAKNSTSPIKTFSIGFEEKKYSELPFAKIVAEKFGTDHTEFIVKPDAIKILPFLVRHYEEPYGDSSALATFYLSKLTRKHVIVALNGDGGDENFAGYPWYSVHKFSLWYEKLLPIHNFFVKPIATILAKYIHTKFFNRANLFSHMIAQDYARRYVNYIAYFTNEMKSNLYTDTFKKSVWAENTTNLILQKFQEAGGKNKIDQALYTDIATYLSDDLLVKVDVATMSVSLEGRSPFLDHEFMELVAQIPTNLKLKGLNNKKYILKKALNNLLPRRIMYRKKQGFGLPIEMWFRKDLKNYAHDILLSDKALSRGLFQKKGIENLLRVHETTGISNAHRIWALITLELWFREYF